MSRVACLVVVLMGLQGCMSVPPHRCRLATDNPDCHTMQQVYDRARRTPPAASTMEQVMKTDQGHLGPSAPKAPAPNPDALRSEPGSVGQPIFREPTVHRVWLAPYVDADGNLHSGEFSYFSTPGEWAYGSLRADGPASEATLFAPSRREDLGFTPATAKAGPRQTATLLPPKPTAPSLTPAPSAGITPPAQKLTD